MKNRMLRICAMALVLAVLTGGAALAQVNFRGTVISRETLAVSAPFGGLIDAIDVRKGDPVGVGDAVATIRTTKVYAEMDGIVSGIFAKEGDNTEGITERYGGVMYLEPINKYVVSATTEKAYNSSDTKYVHIGERVYLSCTKDGTHVGTAVVTKVSEVDESGNTPYTLEVTGGEFYMGETVGIFRSSSHGSESRIGRGTIQQNAAVPVKGSGSVLKVHVEVGDHVERGEVLFETVEGILDGLYAVDNTIRSPLDGIVASVEATQGSAVEKGGKLITVYPNNAMQIEMQVSELDLSEIHEGDRVSIEFEWDADGAVMLDGVVSSISRVGAEKAEGSTGSSSTEATYSAYVDFTPVESVRLDMSVIVYVVDPEDEDDDFEDELMDEAEEEAVEEEAAQADEDDAADQ
ncbi:MAG: HlyD family efflux transporter periplasmic adaptor subunit [Clostridia bacterium]|nr:HlyD family efflux transporter periplasmic adaptor subunit [Clostridia bacterium]